MRLIAKSFSKPTTFHMDLAVGFLNAYHPLPEEFIDEFKSTLSEVRYRKGETLLEQGTYSTHLYFIISGMVIGCTNRKGKMMTSYICMDGELISSISGMYGRSPSDESIYAIEDCLLLALPIPDMVRWLETSPEMNIITRKIVEELYRSAHERSNLLRMGTPLEKYEHYLSILPPHMSRIPITYIADYLDIKPKTLARILKRKQDEAGQLLTKQRCEAIYNYMTIDHAFKQKKLTLSSMASALSIPAYQLSRLLNIHYKMGFNSFVNTHRINYIKEQLHHPENWQHLTIEGLGIEGGFSSRSVFFAKFKQHTGLSPSTYAKTLQDLVSPNL